jgi:hypothetical protein
VHAGGVGTSRTDRAFCSICAPRTLPPATLGRTGRLARASELAAQVIGTWVERVAAVRRERPGALTTTERDAQAAPEARPAADARGRPPAASLRLVRAGDRHGSESLFGFVTADRAAFAVAVMCRALRDSDGGGTDRLLARTEARCPR